MSTNFTLDGFCKLAIFRKQELKLMLIYYMSFNCYLVIGIKGFAGY